MVWIQVSVHMAIERGLQAARRGSTPPLRDHGDTPPPYSDPCIFLHAVAMNRCSSR